MTTPIEKIQLTDKQKKVLDFIAYFIEENKYPPTSREIKDHFQFSSQTSSMEYLRALRGKGWISWIDGKPRTITLL